METKRKAKIFHSSTILLSLLCQTFAQFLHQSKNNNILANEVHVGVILDMESWEGQAIQSSISMATSDFYTLHPHYKTRLVLRTVDSGGKPFRALSAVVDLLKSTTVRAVINAETTLETELLAELGDKVKIPVISFSSINPSTSSAKYPYFVQVTENETSQVQGIAAIVEAFKWKDVVFIYEDTNYGRDIIPYLFESLGEKNIKIAHMAAVAVSWEDGRIVEELSKLIALQNEVFVVHMSHFLVSRVCMIAKKLGMISEGYAWIMTSKSMNHFSSIDSSIVESMQGVIGFKSHVPLSKELRNFTNRWKKTVHALKSNTEIAELSAFYLRAYDVAWSLAKAAENARTKISLSNLLVDLDNLTTFEHGTILLQEILQSKFQGLSGDFEFANQKLVSNAFEIVNVIGRGDRRVGYWTPGKIRRELPSSNNNFASDLETIIWPGGSATIPRGYSYTTQATGKKLRVAVPEVAVFSEFVKMNHDHQTNKTTFTGFSIDVFIAAIQALPYKVDYEFIPFNNDKGHADFNELIYQVHLRKYDAAVGPIIITSNRSLYVDFTITYSDLGVGMVAPRKTEKNLWIFLKPLTLDLWLSSTVFFLLTGFVVWVIEHPINQEFQGSAPYQIGTIFWFSFSTMVFAHRENLLNNLSRFVVIVWVFVVLVLTNSYTATLTSMLTVSQIQLNTKHKYYIGQHLNSPINSELDTLVNFNNGSSGLKNFVSPQEFKEALSKGSKHGGVSAVVLPMPYIKAFLARYPKHYSMVLSTTSCNGFGFALPKGWPLVSDLSTAIAKLREEGRLSEMEEAWLRTSSTWTDLESDTDNVDPLSFENFRGLFLVSGLSSTLALMVVSVLMLRRNWQVVRSHISRVIFCRSPER